MARRSVEVVDNETWVRWSEERLRYALSVQRRIGQNSHLTGPERTSGMNLCKQAIYRLYLDLKEADREDAAKAIIEKSQSSPRLPRPELNREVTFQKIRDSLVALQEGIKPSDYLAPVLKNAVQTDITALQNFQEAIVSGKSLRGGAPRIIATPPYTTGGEEINLYGLFLYSITIEHLLKEGSEFNLAEALMRRLEVDWPGSHNINRLIEEADLAHQAAGNLDQQADKQIDWIFPTKIEGISFVIRHYYSKVNNGFLIPDPSFFLGFEPSLVEGVKL